MPSLIEYQQRTSAQGPLGPGPQSDAGAAAFTQLGAQIANDIERREARKEREAEEAALVSANEDLQSARSHWSTELQRRQAEAPAGAAGFTQSVLADFDADAKERVKRAKTQHSREQLKARLADVRLGLQEDAQRFETGSATADRVNRLEGSVESARTAVNFRPGDFDKIHTEVLTAIAGSGLTAEQRVKAAESASQALSVAAVDGMIRNDPRGTLKELNNEKTQNSAIAGMGLDERERARSRAQSEINRLDQQARAARAEAQDTLRADTQDAFTARALGLPAALPERSRYVAAYGSEGGERYRKDQARWKIFDVAGEAAYQTPAEAAKTLEVLKPKTQDGAHEAQGNYEAAVQIYARQRKALEENPVAVLESRNPNIAALHEAAAKDPAQIPMYFGALRAQQATLGIAEPKLLSDAKRTEIAAALVYNVDKPAQRTEVLRSLQAAYGDDYVDVMREVAPKLDGMGRVLINMLPPAAQRLDAAYAQKENLAKTVPEKTRTEIDEAVRTELAEFASTLSDQPDFADRYAEHFEATRLFAQSLAAAGASPADAARNAASQVINDQYHFTDGLRIPATYDEDIITLSLNTQKATLAKSGKFIVSGVLPFSTPEAAQEDMRNLIARSGYWTTNENGTGVVLKIPHRQGMGEVYRENGTRVEFTFEALAGMDHSANYVPYEGY
jgi:hypothetical protein